ncbi:MAG: phosphoribosyltransferase [Parcubacteria group bacterium Gr01-1014_38]|nr:MAG: phosphoribosyltransferase [Parcubacteria group bacterium Gr01-1014_38]
MSLRAGVRSTARAVLDLLFPIACVGCGTYQETSTDEAGRWLCAACRQRLTPDAPVCLVCGLRAPTGRTCYTCLPRTPLAGSVAVGLYRDPILRSAISTFKFRGVRALAGPLGDLLARKIAAAGLLRQSPDGALPALVPLPLHPRRERARGFNQAQLLAEAMGMHLGLPVTPLLFRTRSTSPQTSLLGSAAVRRQNVARAFALRSGVPHPPPPRLVLVDDVLTSGATLEAAAGVLASAGAKELWAAVVARG